MKEKIENTRNLLGEINEELIGFEQDGGQAQELVSCMLDLLEEFEDIMEDKLC